MPVGYASRSHHNEKYFISSIIIMTYFYLKKSANSTQKEYSLWNGLKLAFLFACIVFFSLSCDNGDDSGSRTTTEKAVKCLCITNGLLTVEISKESKAEAEKVCINKLAGQIQSCE